MQIHIHIQTYIHTNMYKQHIHGSARCNTARPPNLIWCVPVGAQHSYQLVATLIWCSCGRATQVPAARRSCSLRLDACRQRNGRWGRREGEAGGQRDSGRGGSRQGRRGQRGRGRGWTEEGMAGRMSRRAGRTGEADEPPSSPPLRFQHHKQRHESLAEWPRKRKEMQCLSSPRRRRRRRRPAFEIWIRTHAGVLTI